MVNLVLRILLVAVVFLSSFSGVFSPASAVMLNVPLVPQKLDNWCWAATAEMVKNYLNPELHVQQCAEVNAALEADAAASTTPPGQAVAPVNCCPLPQDDETLARCDTVGWPRFVAPDFKAEDSSLAPPPMMSWSDVKKEIGVAHRPFVYVRKDVGGGGHIVVIQGYGRDNGVRYVLVNDPWPVNEGKTSWYTYAWYSAQGRHLRDIHSITYTGSDK